MENLTNLLDYIVEEALVLVPALLIIGKIIKMKPGVQSWIIPYVLLVLGVIGSSAMLGLSAESVIQGVLVAGAAVFVHQLVKQGREGAGE